MHVEDRAKRMRSREEKGNEGGKQPWETWEERFQLTRPIISIFIQTSISVTAAKIWTWMKLIANQS